MNETIKTIMNRRSIRAYKEEQISEEELKTIIDAGLYAPSAMNQQSWHFTIVEKKELINKISDVCKGIMQRTNDSNFNIFYNAPTVIIISGDDKAIAPKNDGSLAMGNMLLAAQSLGIGSCWIHAVTVLSSTEEGRKLISELGIPEGYSIICSGAFGYKAADAAAAAPRKEGTVNIIK